MEHKLLREVQLVQLEIAKEVKRICEKYEINYFLDAGTLLGAVRHQGFIPWDDDLDIGMLREEYEKFVQVAPAELDDHYVLQNFDTDENYIRPFAKIRKKDTLYVEHPNIHSEMKEQGIYIDLFPYDTAPADSKEWEALQKRMVNITRFLSLKCHVQPWLGCKGKNKVIRFTKYQPYRVITLFMSKDKIRKKFKSLMDISKAFDGELYSRSFGQHKYPAKLLESYGTVTFEGEQFSAPSDYDAVLKIHFGNYMELPPEDKRGDRHHIIKVKL